ncbi:MAG: IS66 family insertion sequence element accessory protein TnpB [Bacteroides sp.]|jgi:hypothetical protein|nr:IS66 family insertion sequence element accessory protein TnpB [Bacteroides sp.]MCI1683615.1 IS66 family insertion sequence element accessory protein TnpB [Bacteroides sp.]
MISYTTEQHYYLYGSPADMRKDIDGLCGLIRNAMRKDPMIQDQVYVFLSKDLRKMKLLYRGFHRFELTKIRLDDDKFFLPVVDSDRKYGKISWSDFVLLTEGVAKRNIRMEYLDD